MSKENKSKKVLKTQFSYNPLWKMLIDRGLKKRELQEMSEVSATSIAKLGRNENVTTEVLLRISQIDLMISTRNLLKKAMDSKRISTNILLRVSSLYQLVHVGVRLQQKHILRKSER